LLTPFKLFPQIKQTNKQTVILRRRVLFCKNKKSDYFGYFPSIVHSKMQLLPFVPIALVKHRPLVEKNVIVAIQAVIISLWPEYTSDLFFLSPFFLPPNPIICHSNSC